MTCNNRNLKLPFLATRFLYWRGVDLPVDLPIWPVTIAIWNCHYWPLDASTWGGDTSASWSAYVTCNNSNLKLPALATRCLYCGVHQPVDLPIWPETIAIWNCHSWPLGTSTWGGGRSASWSAYMTCNNSNLKLPFLATRCLYWRVHLPVDLTMWPVTIAIWNCHSWPLDASTGGYFCQLICLCDL